MTSSVTNNNYICNTKLKIMDSEKYTTYQLSISAILGLIEANDIAIPEIQRPFVWKKIQVKELMDSLYRGYPTGYLTLWKNPNVKLKDGKISAGKKILIDGQQRVTALMTAISGKTIINSDYKEDRIKIAFNPLAEINMKRMWIYLRSKIHLI